MRMSSDVVFVGAIALTAFTDNAALTYLGSLVEGLSDSFKYALVAGAVTGGGLTIIANAPNPAGIAILRQHFDDGVVHPRNMGGGVAADRGGGVDLLVVVVLDQNFVEILIVCVAIGKAWCPLMDTV